MKNLLPKTKLSRIACGEALTLITALWASPVCGEGTVVYSGFVGQPFFSNELDFDGAGTDEFVFHADFDWIQLEEAPVIIPGTVTYSVTCSLLTSVLVDGAHLQVVDAGAQIGPSEGSDLWSAASSTLLIMLQAPTTPEPTYGGFEQTGPLADAEIGYLGFRWERPDGWHYGWVQLSNQQVFEDPEQFRPLPMIVDWAYEMRPDVPIHAGVIPEPTAWSLVLVGGLAIGVWRAFRRALLAAHE